MFVQKRLENRSVLRLRHPVHHDDTVPHQGLHHLQVLADIRDLLKGKLLGSEVVACASPQPHRFSGRRPHPRIAAVRAQPLHVHEPRLQRPRPWRRLQLLRHDVCVGPEEGRVEHAGLGLTVIPLHAQPIAVLQVNIVRRKRRRTALDHRCVAEDPLSGRSAHVRRVPASVAQPDGMEAERRTILKGDIHVAPVCARLLDERLLGCGGRRAAPASEGHRQRTRAHKEAAGGRL
mmetsp:Transcript_44531/g.128729  ORF Transcript_44531/g.128729 Transcript_44531/m.128729 type:complete len:233 (+) Transcript_44531:891-1589(+)